MKKVLIITEKYYPLTGANTVCCQNVADHLIKNGCQVDVVAIKQSYTEESPCVNGVRVKKLNTIKEDFVKLFGKKYNVTEWEKLPKFIRVFSDFLAKTKYFFATKTQRLYLDTLNIKRVYKEIKKDWGTYDCIISTCAPFSLTVMSKKLKDMGLSKNWIALLLDTYVHDAFLSKEPKKLKKRKKIAEKTLNKADKIFALEGVVGGNLENNYNPTYHQNTVEIYPITLREQINTSNDSKSTQLIYAGRFYNKIRTPKEMLKVLSNLPSDYTLNLYSHGCEEIVEEQEKLFDKCKLVKYGNVTHAECLENIGKSDILVNLGNTISNQMPSKVLEYMGFCKPIINFYQNQDDMGLKMFNAYPLAFNFNLNNYTQEDIENLIEFCNKNKNTIIDYATATKDLQEYTCETICSKIYQEIIK